MAALTIRVQGDPVLRQVARPVRKVTRRLQRLIRDMRETMYAHDGVGLAAPQVGISERVIVVDAGSGFIALVNPKIVRQEGVNVDVEGCLSIPGVLGYVERAARVEVTGWDENGQDRRVEATGLLARALQHEIDHLDGVLFIDKATAVFKEEAVRPRQVAAPRGGDAAGEPEVFSSVAAARSDLHSTEGA